MTATLTAPAETAGRLHVQRSSALDRIRGLALLLMAADHLALFLHAVPVRLTLGRLALPLFFLLAGHLASRLTTRHLYALGIGAALPVVSPWIDSPNVLLWWVLGCALLLAFRHLGWPVALLVVVPLTFAANHWSMPLGSSYMPWALVGLMALGSLLPRSSFAWGDRLPSFLAPLGRRPLTFYVAHVLALSVAFA